MCAKAYFKKRFKKSIILDELHKLPHRFCVLKNRFLRLRWFVTYQNTSESFNSCQIDYLVIGPTGVFIIEAKNWDDDYYTQKLPHIEVDKAGLVVYIKLSNHFRRYIPINNIVVTNRKVPIVKYGRVEQLFIWQLTPFIFSFKNCVSNSEIRKIKRLL
jgi:hypothetical protein